MPLEVLLFSTLYKDASLCSDTSTKQPRLRDLTDNEKARVKEHTYTKQMLISFKKKKKSKSLDTRSSMLLFFHLPKDDTF